MEYPFPLSSNTIPDLPPPSDRPAIFNSNICQYIVLGFIEDLWFLYTTPALISYRWEIILLEFSLSKKFWMIVRNFFPEILTKFGMDPAEICHIFFKNETFTFTSLQEQLFETGFLDKNYS